MPVNQDSENWFTVCLYGPPGNYIGQFGDNVGVQILGEPNKGA